MDSEPPEWQTDPHEELDDWEVITTDRCGAKHMVFLSSREEDKHKATFIVAEAEAVADLVDKR